jgi:hypothetical protein
MPFTYM